MDPLEIRSFGDKNEMRMSCVALLGPHDYPKQIKSKLVNKPESGPLKGCKGHKTHRFENGGTHQIRKTGKREVVLSQPLPQTLQVCCLVEFTDGV